MKSTLDFLVAQIAILQDATDTREADFVCYKTSNPIIDMKSYAVNQLADENAMLLSIRTGINENSFAIACVYDNEPYLVHDIAFDDFINVLNFSSSTLATIIKNCNTQHRSKILSYLETKNLDKLITSHTNSNHLAF